MNQLPTRKELMNAILDVMNQKGEKMTTSDIDKEVIKYLSIPSNLLEIEDTNCTGTEYSYRMRCARTELKRKGYIKNICRGIWEVS